MKYWQKDRNYRKYPNEDGTFRYIITVDGEEVDVSPAVYEAYAQDDRRERYCYEREDGLLLSLERLDEDGMQLAWLGDSHVESAEDSAVREIMTTRMLEILDQLGAEERELIELLFFENISARELARSTGVYHRTIIYRRDRVLEKIRQLMENK